MSRALTMMTTELKEVLSATHSVLVIGPLAKTIPKGKFDFTVFVDGGCHLRAKEHTLTSSLSVGDGDSCPPNTKLDYSIPKEKDYSDLAYLLMNLPKNLAKLELHGFVGGRIDHQLAVFGEVFTYLKEAKTQSVIFDDGSITALGTGTHKLHIEGTFSLMALEFSEVSIRGKAKYLIDPQATLQPLSSYALSNEGSGEVEIRCSLPLILTQGLASTD